MPQATATKDRIPPLFWGGSLTSQPFSRRPKLEGRFRTANHSGMRHIEESGFAALLVRIMPHPPL